MALIYVLVVAVLFVAVLGWLAIPAAAALAVALCALNVVFGPKKKPGQSHAPRRQGLRPCL